MTPNTRRRAFTLIELLVVMALVAGLAAMVMLVAPKVLERDRSVDAVTKLTNSLNIARARALRDGQPRGIRLIIDRNKPVTPLDQRYFVTEFQYIESPPVFVPNPDGPGVGVTPSNKYVEFRYQTDANGTTTLRQCALAGLSAGERAQIVRGSILSLPTLGTYHRLRADAPLTGGTVLLDLDQYPDAPLGAAGPVANNPANPEGVYRTYQFGFYAPPRPLLGQPTEQLPVDTCVDLTPGASEPDGAALLASAALPLPDYDILFGPGGQLMATNATQGAGHVFLWVRDPGKLFPPAGAGISSTPGPTGRNYTLDFRQGGEMMIVAIKGKSGGIGVGPVNWPDAGNTIYPANYDPYLNARKAVTGQ